MRKVEKALLSENHSVFFHQLFILSFVIPFTKREMRSKERPYFCMLAKYLWLLWLYCLEMIIILWVELQREPIFLHVSKISLMTFVIPSRNNIYSMRWVAKKVRLFACSKTSLISFITLSRKDYYSMIWVANILYRTSGVIFFIDYYTAIRDT